MSQKADGFAGGNAGPEDYRWKEEAGARVVGGEGSSSCHTGSIITFGDLIAFDRITATGVVWDAF